jgi:hypothetical protein
VKNYFLLSLIVITVGAKSLWGQDIRIAAVSTPFQYFREGFWYPLDIRLSTKGGFKGLLTIEIGEKDRFSRYLDLPPISDHIITMPVLLFTPSPIRIRILARHRVAAQYTCEYPLQGLKDKDILLGIQEGLEGWPGVPVSLPTGYRIFPFRFDPGAIPRDQAWIYLDAVDALVVQKGGKHGVKLRTALEGTGVRIFDQQRFSDIEWTPREKIGCLDRWLYSLAPEEKWVEGKRVIALYLVLGICFGLGLVLLLRYLGILSGKWFWVLTIAFCLVVSLLIYIVLPQGGLSVVIYEIPKGDGFRGVLVFVRALRQGMYRFAFRGLAKPIMPPGEVSRLNIVIKERGDCEIPYLRSRKGAIWCFWLQGRTHSFALNPFVSDEIIQQRVVRDFDFARIPR